MKLTNRTFGQLFWKAYDLVCLWSLYIAALLFFVISIIVVYEVVMRYFFKSPTAWVVVFSEFFLLIGTFLVAPWLLNTGGHTSVTIVSVKLRGHVRSVWDIFVSILSIITFIIILWPSLLFCIESFQKNRCIYTSMGLIPKYLILWVVPFTSLLLVIGCIKQGLQSIRELRKGKATKDERELTSEWGELI